MPYNLITGAYIPVIQTNTRMRAIDGIHPAGVLAVVFLAQYISATCFRCGDSADIVLFQAIIGNACFIKRCLKYISDCHLVPFKGIGVCSQPCSIPMRCAAVLILSMLGISNQTEGYSRGVRSCVRIFYLFNSNGTHNCRQQVLSLVILQGGCQVMGAQCHTVCIDYKLSKLVGGSQRLVAIIDLCSSNCAVPCIFY